MPREMVTLQVGQCGNQLGARFWEMALHEHGATRQANASTSGRKNTSSVQTPVTPVFDEAMSSFFRNMRRRRRDTEQKEEDDEEMEEGASEEIPRHGKKKKKSTTSKEQSGLQRHETDRDEELSVGSRVESLRARAVLVDMETGVVMREVMRGRVRGLFDTRQLLTDTSGSGNNWAHGHEVYAPQYHAELMESVRHAVEPCESLQGFFMLHSLGGGTGSGLGSALLEQLADEYPSVYRFACSVFPSEEDDVITSPYNAMLSAATLMDAADCVLPIENQALIDICAAAERRRHGRTGGTSSSGSGESATQGAQPFAAMNGIAANMLLHLTSSVRFEGSLNTDLNEIIMNLVPFPKQHFLVSSLAPLLTAPAQHLSGTKSALDVGAGNASRGIDPMMSSLFSREHQLIKADPRNATFVACGLFVRGEATVADLARNVARLKRSQTVRFVDWNPDGFKVGLCSVPPVGVRTSALALSNNCCIRHTFNAMRERFLKLYRKKFYLHHYLQYMDEERFVQADEAVRSLIASYEEIDLNTGTRRTASREPSVHRMHPVGTSFGAGLL